MDSLHSSRSLPEPDASTGTVWLQSRNQVCEALDSATLVRRYKEEMSEKYQAALEYLSEAYCLSEADMLGHEDAFYKLLYCASPFKEFLRAICADDVLLEKCIRNTIKICGIKFDLSRTHELIDPIRNRLSSASDMRTLNFSIQSYLRKIDRVRNKGAQRFILRNRDKAIVTMNAAFEELFESWGNGSEHALTDDQMKHLFRSQQGGNPNHLTTYFDTAQHGIYSEVLRDAVDEESETREQPFRLTESRLRITQALESSWGIEGVRRFVPENCFFHATGSAAFKALAEKVIDEKAKVLVTDEEYGGLINVLRKRDINPHVLGSYIDPAAYREEIAEALRSMQPDFVLVSESSRFGTVFPLADFHRARKLYSPQTKLIVDACQSAGRVEHDMTSCQADAVFLSTNKGGIFGPGVGALVLARGFNQSAEIKAALGAYEESYFHQGVARTGFSMTPEGLFLEEEKPGHALSPKEQGEAVSAVTRKCLDMIELIGDGRISVIRPTNTDKLAHAMEVKIEGVKRQQVVDLAKSYGVHIAEKYTYASDAEAIRLGFHPFMNHDSLKILGFVLQEAIKKYSTS